MREILGRAPYLNTVLTLLVPLVLIAAATDAFGGTVQQRIVTTMFINMILVLGLQVYMGNSGIVSFAHIGFMGIGAYASAVLSMPPDLKAMTLRDLYDVLQPIDLPFWLAVTVGAGVAGIVAAIISYPLMRLSDAAAIITSFALLVVINDVLVHWSEVTNGPRTLFGVERFTYLWTSAGVAFAGLLFAAWFRESRVGLQLRASRDDRVAAQSCGVNMVFVRWVAFVLMCIYAAIAGALWAHFITSFQPGHFYLEEVFLILAMLVIGGPVSVSGAVIGTILVTLAFEGFRALEGYLNINQVFGTQVFGLTEFLLALAMIGILIFRPAGVMRGRELRIGRRHRGRGMTAAKERAAD
jgi:branched-chain amino acid transport system permease protein